MKLKFLNYHKMNVKGLLLNIIIMIGLMTDIICAQEREARITIVSENLELTDTLELYLWRDLIGYEFNAPHQILKQPVCNGMAVFDLDSLADNSFVGLYLSYQKIDSKPANGIIKLARISKEDDILIKISPKQGRFRNVGGGYDNGAPVFIHNWICEFSGDGSGKMEAGYRIERYLDEIETKLSKAGYSLFDNALYSLDYYLSKASEFELIMKSYKNKMKALDYEQVYLDGIGGVYNRLANLLIKFVYTSETKERSQFKTLYYTLFERTKHKLIHAEQIAKSPEYLAFIKKYYDGLMFLERSTEKIKRVISFVNIQISNKFLRDRLITQFMVDNFYNEPKKELYDYVIEVVSDKYCLERIKPLEVFVKGNADLEFSLPDNSGLYHSLSSFRGKVVLVDFWYMGCIPCRSYIQNVVKPLINKFKDDDRFAIILISLDSKGVFTKAVEDGIVPNQALNLFTEGKQFSHSLIKRLALPGYPYPMLIGQDGKVLEVGLSLKSFESVNQLVERKIAE